MQTAIIREICMLLACKSKGEAKRFVYTLRFSTTQRTPKKGLVIAEFSSAPAVFRMALSTLSLGRNKNSLPSSFSNPQSSRNSMPPCRFPTLSCKVNYYRNEHKLQSHVLQQDNKHFANFKIQQFYLKCSIRESNLSEFLLIRIFSNISNISKECLKCPLHFGIVILSQNDHTVNTN